MKYEVSTSQNGLIINFEVPDKRKEKLLEEFSNCQKGKCSCPTEEYRKLEFLCVESSENNIFLILKPKVDQSFDINEINKCLSHTIEKVKEKI